MKGCLVQAAADGLSQTEWKEAGPRTYHLTPSLAVEDSGLLRKLQVLSPGHKEKLVLQPRSLLGKISAAASVSTSRMTA